MNLAKVNIPKHPLHGCMVQVIRIDPFQRFVIVEMVTTVGAYKRGTTLSLKRMQVLNEQ